MTERLRVMTWNIRSAAGGDDAGPVVDRVAQLDRIAEVIDAAGVDIVGLQEVDRFWRRSGGVEQGREIATRVGMDAAFAPNWLPEGGIASDRVPQYGVATLSRWPFRETRHVRHGTPAGWEPRGSLVTAIRTPAGATIAIANTHLQVDPPTDPGSAGDQRRTGLERTLPALLAPAIVLGDFNAQPGSEELAPFDGGWLDAWLEQGAAPGYTFPALIGTDPRERIDYLLVTEGIRVTGIDVLVDDRTRTASDHYPIVAELELA